MRSPSGAAASRDEAGHITFAFAVNSKESNNSNNGEGGSGGPSSISSPSSNNSLDSRGLWRLQGEPERQATGDTPRRGPVSFAVDIQEAPSEGQSGFLSASTISYPDEKSFLSYGVSQFVRRQRASCAALRATMNGSEQVTAQLKREIEIQMKRTKHATEVFRSALGDVEAEMKKQMQKTIGEMIPSDWIIYDTDSLVQVTKLRPVESRVESRVFPRRTTASRSLHVSLNSNVSLPEAASHRSRDRSHLRSPISPIYWEGPSADDIFGDRIFYRSKTPYTLLGVFTVRAKEALVSAAYGDETDKSCCPKTAARRCLPKGEPPPRGLLARPLAPKLLDVCCNKETPYFPPLYAKKEPPVSYPKSSIEDDNVRIDSQLEDYLKEMTNVSILRPPWDHRESPLAKDITFSVYRRMKKRQEQQQKQMHEQQEQQQQQLQQGQHQPCRCFAPMEAFINSLSGVSVHRNLRGPQAVISKTKKICCSLLTSKEKKWVKDFWRLRKKGDTFHWEFEGIQVQDFNEGDREAIEYIPPPSPADVQRQKFEALQRQPNTRMLLILQELEEGPPLKKWFTPPSGSF